MLERLFAIRERGSTVRTEVLGGVVTFLTMAYIVFVNPAILSQAGMPFAAVAVATALAAALFTLLMGLLTNLPFALASGLGLNAIVAFDLILGRELAWPVAMACVVIEGLIALVLVIAGLREAIMRAVPHEIKLSIGVGIGLFIALVGFRDAGITVNDPATGIGLGVLTGGAPLVALGGLLVMIVLTARGVRGAILLGILASTALGLIFGVLEPPDKVAQCPNGERLLDDRRRARPRQPPRRADVGARAGDLRAVRERLLRHDRHRGRRVERGRPARRGRPAAAPEAPAAGRLGRGGGRRRDGRLERHHLRRVRRRRGRGRAGPASRASSPRSASR